MRHCAVPHSCSLGRHNGHIYYLLAPDRPRRSALLAALKRDGIDATSHFSPLHLSPAGRKFGRIAGPLAVTENVAERLVRLPLHLHLTEQDQDKVIDAVIGALRS